MRLLKTTISPPNKHVFFLLHLEFHHERGDPSNVGRITTSGRLLWFGFCWTRMLV